MKSKNEKQYLIIGEIGKQKTIYTNKDLIHALDTSLKDLGLTKNDIILISSNKLLNITNLILQLTNNNSPKEKYIDMISNNFKEDFYLYSKANRHEIYKQQFEHFFKMKIEQNSFIPSKNLFSGGIECNVFDNDETFLGGNKVDSNNNNLEIQKKISFIKEVYTNFKYISINIISNFNLSNLLINENIENIHKSLIILYNYYKSQIQEIRINYETLKSHYEEVSSRVLSIEKKLKNYYTIKMSLNDKKEIKLFESLISENKIKQIREKINNQLNYLKEKIQNKSQKFDCVIKNNILDNKIENKIKNVIDEIILNEIKKRIKEIESEFNSINKKYNKYKFEDEIKQIQENNININLNKSNFSFNNINNKSSSNIEHINLDNQNLINYIGEKDLNGLINTMNNIKNNSEEILLQIKNFIKDSIIKKFFRFSCDIFITLDSFESYNKKFKSYTNLLEKLDKDNYYLLISLDEALKFKFYYTEYKRRINFLKDLKITIYKLKNSLVKENEIRQKFNEELLEYFKGKLTDNKFGMHNNIINFFDWDEIKGNFDVYGDKYYNMIEIKDKDLKNDSKNRNASLIYDNDFYFNKDIYFENNSQQEMIYNLNKRIIEYKSKIKNLEKYIENKNNEFKELKYNIQQINNFLNILNKDNINKNNLEEKKNNNIKKENTIFNPLYDEIIEDESLNNNSNSLNIDTKKEINNKNNISLTIEQTYIIKKSFFNYFTNLLSIKNEEYNKLLSLYNSLQMSIEDKYSQILNLSFISKINLMSINIGTTNLFIGISKNEFICFLLNEYKDCICEYYLDIDDFNNDIKNFINKEKNIIIIGEVKDIKKEQCLEIKEDTLDEKKNDNEYNSRGGNNNNHKKINKKIVILSKIHYLISYSKDLYSNDIFYKNDIIYN